MSNIVEGNIVKFHTPLPDENPNQLFVVLEVKIDGQRSRVDIQALNTGLSFPPINTVLLADIETVEVDTNDLEGHLVTVVKSDFSMVEGRVLSARERKINLSLIKSTEGIHTNVHLTVADHDGLEHDGTLLVIVN